MILDQSYRNRDSGTAGTPRLIHNCKIYVKSIINYYDEDMDKIKKGDIVQALCIHSQDFFDKIKYNFIWHR